MRMGLFSRREKGYALATVLVLLGVAMFGMAAIVTISTLESKIARSQKEGMTAYYVAEAGINDGIWRLNNTPAYSNALVAGTLDVTYSATDVPMSGQGFTVHLYTSPSQGAGYGVVDVNSYSDNGSFQAKRRITAEVFQGTVTSPTGNNSFFSGNRATITNGNAALTITGGGFYGTQTLIVNNATVNLGSNNFYSTSNFNSNAQSNLTYGTISAANYPPAATAIPAPGIDFTYYGTNYSVRYTPAQFQSVISSGGGTINFPGPVTFIDGDVLMNNWARNKTLNFTGMLIVNGNFTITSAASNLNINFADPGNGKSGIFVRSNLSVSNGTWVVNGIMYASGNMNFTSTRAITINGALIAGGDIQINNGQPMTINFNATRVNASFGSGAPLNVQVQHWEEEY